MSTSVLTPRQVEFLALSARGMQRSEIAETCYVAPMTVRDTLEEARSRLGARTLPHAVAIAVALGVLTLDEVGCASPTIIVIAA